MRAPRPLALGTAAAALLLSGCGQSTPTPLVSVVSGGATVHSEAVSYCFDGQKPSAKPGTPGACRTDTNSRPTLLSVKNGEQVGVDVSKQVADKAWVVVLAPQGPGANGQPAQEQSSPVQEGHYFAFNPGFAGGPIELQVRSLASAAPGAAVTGLWRFVLAPQ